MQQGLFDVKKLELGFADMSQALPHIQQAFKEMYLSRSDEILSAILMNNGLKSNLFMGADDSDILALFEIMINNPNSPLYSFLKIQ